MKLLSIIKNLEYYTSMKDIEVTGLTCDSRRLSEGNIFICMKGAKFDGYEYVEKALNDGAVAIVTEHDLKIKNQIIVKNSRYAYGIMCSNFFNNPSKKLKMIAITGTNGKTTCAFLVKQILSQLGKKVGLMGTIHNEIGDMILPTKNTTPDSFSLQSMLARMVKAKCEYVVMEASSHALDQFRLAGIEFEVGAFTNLTVDHLDYHITMDNYYEAKKKLFDISKKAVINIDDEYGKRLANEIKNTTTFSIKSENADYFAKNITAMPSGSKFDFIWDKNTVAMQISTPGDFSLSNAITAILCCVNLGYDVVEIAQVIKNCGGVCGRLEVLHADEQCTIIRDYAHAPDALEKVLQTIRKFSKGRVVMLFGCAGCRDRKKRAEMGRIVEENADFLIITSDNPREEDPSQIIDDALLGMKDESKRKVIVDRYDAIKWAVENIKKDDVLILAGKGHEDYQVFDFGSVYFNEKELVEEFLSGTMLDNVEG